MASEMPGMKRLSVRATRYDGDRVYVVTAIRMDPLWIVDNANPARPQLVSHLEVPGWSTYIEPLGDRLVTVGVMPISPTKAPAWRPFTYAPTAGQASSITTSLCAPAMDITHSISGEQPAQCTGRMARVFGVIASGILAVSI